jgi:ribosome modulation factor
MGRKKGDKKSGSASAPKQTLEGISDDQLYSLTEQHRQNYETILEAKNKANKALIDYGKIIKADLGAKGLQDIKDLISLDTPEGEAAMKAEMERKARVMRWMNIPIGTQGGLFADADRTPLTERAFNEGKRQGLAGESCDNPHHHTTAAHKSHNEGWAAGQEAKATKGFSKLDPADAADLKKAASIGSSRATFEVAQH